jgi:hypothetical protein
MPEDDPDYEKMKMALNKLQEEVDGINKNKAGTENLKKMLELHNNIEGLKVSHTKKILMLS